MRPNCNKTKNYPRNFRPAVFSENAEQMQDQRADQQRPEDRGKRHEHDEPRVFRLVPAKDHAEAAKWYRKAAEGGVVDAWNNLGVCYQNGHGVEQNYAEAAKCFRKAAERGIPAALTNLGVCYQNGRGVEKNYAEAAKCYRKAAEQGLAQAQSALGASYLFGFGVPKDRTEAAYWYCKAAAQGDPQARKMCRELNVKWE